MKYWGDFPRIVLRLALSSALQRGIRSCSDFVKLFDSLLTGTHQYFPFVRRVAQIIVSATLA